MLGSSLPSRPLLDETMVNGISENAVPGTSVQVDESRTEDGNASIEKKNSLGRSGHVAAAANRLNRKPQSSGLGAGLGMIARHAVTRDSVGSLGEQSRVSAESERHGVELSDRPMDF